MVERISGNPPINNHSVNETGDSPNQQGIAILNKMAALLQQLEQASDPHTREDLLQQMNDLYTQLQQIQGLQTQGTLFSAETLEQTIGGQLQLILRDITRFPDLLPQDCAQFTLWIDVFIKGLSSSGKS